MSEGTSTEDKDRALRACALRYKAVLGRSTWILGLVLTLACDRQPEKPKPGSVGTASPSTLPVSNAPQSSASSFEDAVEPIVLMSLPRSAYHTTIALDDEAVYVLTSDAAFRIVFGQTPQRRPLDLGYGATITNHSILFWSQGAVWRVPKQGGEAQRLLTLAHRPQFFVSSGDEFAWVDRSEEDLYTIQTLHGRKATMVYSSPGQIDSVAMVDDWVVFVERVKEPSWRFGRVRTRGGSPAFTDAKAPRTPPMLTAWRDEIYYYHGPKGGVRRLSLDLQRDDVLVKDFICSPMAVAERIYCCQVPGLFEVSGDDQPPRHLTRNRGQMMTAIAANSTSVAWVSDTGPDQMAVMMLPATRP